ncbi:hypothetical protein BGW38_000399 [Lunasporangiospora selenospora]|uniref:CLIP1 zinc knuckle domain-containing protein n=1 Tax=Lunasporangiospora selenospora TaxID=979761 RepID=A0A9P6FUX3_9FUNG|nr:hypothetical protein BGW38_000399 [Lunasporangiospora selenospora]
MPQPLTARTGPSHSQSPSTASTPGSSIRASSPTVRSLTGMSGSPTTPRTIQSGAASARANSPSPAPKPINRASSPTTRVTLGSRLSQSGAKPGLQSLQNRTAAHSRSTSTSSSVASQSSPSGPRVRTSPTPGRTNTASRRLSSRSETPDATNILSPSESHSNLLDQATAIQMGMAQDGAPSPSLDMFGKEHVREVADERVLQELEDLNLMKSVWEKERAAKDQEIQVMTEKMTQAWLEAARSQKEKTALLQEKEELAEKLKDLEENGRVSDNAESGYGSEAQQAVIELLQKDLQEATMRASTLEAEVQDVTARAIEDEVKATKEHEELRTAEESLHLEQLALLEQERELLDSKISDLEASSRATSETLGAQLKAALDEAAASKDRIEQLQGALDSEQSVGQQHATKSKERVETLENELHMSQEQHLKSEKLVRSLDEKVKEHETLLSKREQEIVGLKSELDEMTGMVQSEEVDRMRKVWELEKKRLEEAVAENITVMTSLRSEIQVLEMTEEELSDRVKSLEANTATLSEAKASCDAEIEHLQKEANNLQSVHEQEKESLKAKIAETEASVETRLAESNEAIEQLEIVAQSVDEWRERCEAMQLEMIQKTAKLEDIGFELADAQAQNETLKKKYEETIIELENKPSGPSAAQLVEIESVKAELAALLEEREQLKVKTSELEAALALSASSQSTSAPSNTGDAEVVRNREELEDEIANLKKMVHNLTKENVSVASINKKLMQEHDNLMEAHKHVETECLKLMDEVERLHTESLAMVSMEVPASVDKDETENGHRSIDSKEELKASLESRDAAAADKQNGQNSSSSVIRLEGLLKDKQAMLDRLTQTHALEMRELRQRYVELDRTKSWEVSQLNKELTELESLIESKIFHEADLEEEVQKKQKDIERLQAEISDLKSQLARAGGSSIGSYADLPPLNGSAIGLKGYGQGSRVEGRSRTVTNSTDKALFCEICEMEGHDLITCDAVFGSKSGANAGNTNLPPAFSTTEVDDDRPYCDNCEEFGDHYTDECPNESLTRGNCI